jgi:hypothetical protein
MLRVQDPQFGHCSECGESISRRVSFMAGTFGWRPGLGRIPQNRGERRYPGRVFDTLVLHRLPGRDATSVLVPLLIFRAFTCRRARERRVGTSSGMITHGDCSQMTGPIPTALRPIQSLAGLTRHRKPARRPRPPGIARMQTLQLGHRPTLPIVLLFPVAGYHFFGSYPSRAPFSTPVVGRYVPWSWGCLPLAETQVASAVAYQGEYPVLPCRRG